MMRPKIAVTMGDPAGIGPEICVKAYANGAFHAILLSSGKGGDAMRYTTVLIDLDNTLLDFNASSREALEKTFVHFGLPYALEEWDVRYRYHRQRSRWRGVRLHAEPV